MGRSSAVYDNSDHVNASATLHPYQNSRNGDVEMVSGAGDREDNIYMHADLQDVARKRKSNWWIVASYNVTAIIGVGVLALPNAMVYLTWTGGLVVSFMAWTITLFTLWQMVELHEFEFGTRYNQYHKLGERAYGARGFWSVLLLQLLAEVSLDIVFMVIAGISMQYAYFLVTNDHNSNVLIWIAIFTSIQVFLAMLTTFDLMTTFEAIKPVVLLAAAMSICYTTIAWTLAASSQHKLLVNAGSSRPPLGPISYHLPDKLPVNTGYPQVEQKDVKMSDADYVFHIFNAIGVFAFAYAGHNVVLEIQNELPSENHNSKDAMWFGVKVAYVLVAICYTLVAIFGYWAYGNQITDDIFTFVSCPKQVVIVANIMVIIHVIGSYQIFAVPVFIQLETILRVPRRSKWKILIIRITYIGITMFAAMLLPFFSALLGFFGGFFFGPTTYFLPSILWLKLKHPAPWKWDWIMSWVCIIFGVTLMIVSAIGGFRTLYIGWSTYKVFGRNPQGF